MSQTELEGIANRQGCEHVLVIQEDDRTIVFRDLCVIRTQAIWPNITDQRSSGNTPYLVTIGDARYYAPYANLQEQHNYRAVDNRRIQSTGNRSAREVLLELWKELKAVFAQDLTFRNVNDTLLESLNLLGS